MLTNSLLYYFFLVYLARSKRPNTPHFVFKRIVRNFEVREISTKLDMYYRGLLHILICSNDDPGVTLTYFTARSNLVI